MSKNKKMFLNKITLNNKIANLAWKFFNKFENNGNANFSTNGEKIFLDNLFNYYSNNSSTKIILDIGANIGGYSSVLLDIANKNKNKNINIHLFEPTKDCFHELRKKFLNNKNVILNNFGLSDKKEKCKIFYDKEKSGLASLHQRNLDHYDMSLSSHEIISIQRVDEYIENSYIEHIDFIKIDIEGHELKALKGFGEYLNGDFIDIVQFEYGGANLDSHTSLMEICTFLSKRKYKLFKIMKDGLQERDYQPYMENFMNSNYIAMSQSIVKKIG